MKETYKKDTSDQPNNTRIDMKKLAFFPCTRAISRKMRTLKNCVHAQMEDVIDGKTNIFLFMVFTMG